ncbi:MAG: hypothetical protein ABF370_22390 [Verrucomicrobiales bacterium]
MVDTVDRADFTLVNRAGHNILNGYQGGLQTSLGWRSLPIVNDIRLNTTDPKRARERRAPLK